MLEDCITFLIWVAWVLFNFYEPNQRFQSGALLKMLPSSPSVEEFYLDIQKISKLIKHTKKTGFKSNFKYTEDVYITGYSS